MYADDNTGYFTINHMLYCYQMKEYFISFHLNFLQWKKSPISEIAICTART